MNDEHALKDRPALSDNAVSSPVARRDLVSALVALAGAAALGSCGQTTAKLEEEEEPIGAVVQALTGTALRWADTVLGVARAGDLATQNSSAIGNAIVVIARGCIVAGDGGGGVFYWESGVTTGDDGGTIIVPSGSPTGRWCRVYSGALDVKWFGARGDNSANDQSAIQAAIDASTRLGLAVYFPGGLYRIESTLYVLADTANDQEGVRLVGPNGGVDLPYPKRAAIVWNGNSSTAPMLALWSRACLIEHLHFDVAPGKTALCAVDVTPSNGAGALACTDNAFRYIRIAPDLGGAFTHGVKIGDLVNGSYPSNCDFFTFDHVYINDIADSCVYCPNTSGQSKSHAFYRCDFLSAQYALRFGRGSFYLDKSSFSYMSGSAIHFDTAPADAISIRDCASEGCARILSSSGGAAAACPIKIDGGRYNCEGTLASDGLYIDHKMMGPLSIEGAVFEHTQPNTFRIRVGRDSYEASGVLVAIGSTFPNATPFVNYTAQRRIVLGCNRNNGIDGEAAPIDDEIFGFGVSNGGTLPSPERLRLGNAFITNNTCGTVQIVDAATTAAVSFATAEANATYRVLLGVDSISGAATVSSPFASGKTTTGFVVNVPTAPGSIGSGRSLTISWMLVRLS